MFANNGQLQPGSPWCRRLYQCWGLAWLDRTFSRDRYRCIPTFNNACFVHQNVPGRPWRRSPLEGSSSSDHKKPAALPLMPLESTTTYVAATVEHIRCLRCACTS
jgi:hypothetical protein